MYRKIRYPRKKIVKIANSITLKSSSLSLSLLPFKFIAVWRRKKKWNKNLQNSRRLVSNQMRSHVIFTGLNREGLKFEYYPKDLILKTFRRNIEPIFEQKKNCQQISSSNRFSSSSSFI